MATGGTSKGKVQKGGVGQSFSHAEWGGGTKGFGLVWTQ